jgi:site-specific DNA-adenine methylase
MNLDLFGKPIFPDIKNIRIPYMGSKNKIAVELLQKMLEIKPNAKYFYDLFGGGGSMSFTALQLGLKVHYNEKQKGMVDLLKYITNPILAGKYGLFPDDFYNFITREEFFDLINQDTLKSQFAKICYSFGNRQKTYAFGKDIEELKHLGHNIVVFQCKNSLEKFNQITNSNFVLSDAKTWNKRRFDFMSQVKGRSKYKELEQLEQLQRLEQLEQLQQLSVFTITNLDFRDVKIETPIDKTIIYLDPPYRGTATYIEKCFFEDIDNYFKNSPYDCFMSEYNAPFKSILEIEKRCTFSSANNSLVKIEKLFYNKS